MGAGDKHSAPKFVSPERGTAPFERYSFSPEQELHIYLMRHIAQEVTGDTHSNFVLKGGTALLLAYGLPRFSEDLDFDGRLWHLDPTERIHRGASRAGIPLSHMKRMVSTETKRKHRINYPSGRSGSLKLEFSYRQANEIQPDTVTLIDGIKVYTIDKLAEQKIRALHERTKPRDIFDVSFITQQYPDAISDHDLLRLHDYITERGMNWLEEQMLEDPILSQHAVDHVAVVLCDNVATLMTARGLQD